MTKHMRYYTLREVEQMWRDGRISESVVRTYLHLWNTTSMRFTVAYLQDGAIRQRNKRDDE